MNDTTSPSTGSVRPQNRHLKRGGSPGRPSGSGLWATCLKLGRRLAATAPAPEKGAKALAEHLWTDQEFLALALAQAASGKDPALRLRLLDHALGKPIERLQVERAPIELVGENWDRDPLPPKPPPRPLSPVTRDLTPRDFVDPYP